MIHFWGKRDINCKFHNSCATGDYGAGKKVQNLSSFLSHNFFTSFSHMKDNGIRRYVDQVAFFYNCNCKFHVHLTWVFDSMGYGTKVTVKGSCLFITFKRLLYLLSGQCSSSIPIVFFLIKNNDDQICNCSIPSNKVYKLNTNIFCLIQLDLQW